MIVATRFGFHGKKGLAGAVTGCETDHDRDPRVRFISFPMAECNDVSRRGDSFDVEPYRRELAALLYQFGRRLSVLITEPYLGGGGSYHPPAAYLKMLQDFCREHDLTFILDEVQANFGRTGDLFAYETYGLEPDLVVLGKGLGNGVPVAAAVELRPIYSAASNSATARYVETDPLCCAAVLATLEEFASRDVLAQCRRSSAIIERGLVRLKELPFIAQVRGEKGGMVWGVGKRASTPARAPADWVFAIVLACYRGGNDGIHLLGPLAKRWCACRRRW